MEKYESYLGNSEFIKYGIVCSHLVWEKSYSDISRAFCVSKSYISQVLKRWEGDHIFSDKRVNNGGSNKKISKRKRDSMVTMIEESRATSVQHIATELAGEFDLKVGTTAVFESLKDMGFVKVQPMKIPTLTNKAIELREEYATLHLEDKFTNVCFSDEVIFQLSENRQLYWWNPKTEEKPTFQESLDKKKIMLWGGISRKGKTDLYFWKISKELKVDALEYTECLEEVLISKMDSLYGKGKWRFMQDNAGPHTATHTQEYFKKKKLRLLSHPPYSPDLNPIEKVWAYLKKKVMVRVYLDLDEVLSRVTEEWENIPQTMINNLIDHHCKRVKEVHELGGGFI